MKSTKKSSNVTSKDEKNEGTSDKSPPITRGRPASQRKKFKKSLGPDFLDPLELGPTYASKRGVHQVSDLKASSSSNIAVVTPNSSAPRKLTQLCSKCESEYGNDLDLNGDVRSEDPSTCMLCGESPRGTVLSSKRQRKVNNKATPAPKSTPSTPILRPISAITTTPSVTPTPVATITTTALEAATETTTVTAVTTASITSSSSPLSSVDSDAHPIAHIPSEDELSVANSTEATEAPALQITSPIECKVSTELSQQTIGDSDQNDVTADDEPMVTEEAIKVEESDDKEIIDEKIEEDDENKMQIDNEPCVVVSEGTVKDEENLECEVTLDEVAIESAQASESATEAQTGKEDQEVREQQQQQASNENAEGKIEMSSESTQVNETNVEVSASLTSNLSSTESTSSISDEAKANYRFRSPETWSVDEVEQFITSTGFIRESQTFKEQEIDGKSLLLLKRDDVLTGLGFKLGPALKIYSFIHHLQNFNLLTVLPTPPGSVTTESTNDTETITSTNVNNNVNATVSTASDAINESSHQPANTEVNTTQVDTDINCVEAVSNESKANEIDEPIVKDAATVSLVHENDISAEPAASTTLPLESAVET